MKKRDWLTMAQDPEPEPPAVPPSEQVPTSPEQPSDKGKKRGYRTPPPPPPPPPQPPPEQPSNEPSSSERK
jgi:protein TonB